MLSFDLLQSTLVCPADLRYLGSIFWLFKLFGLGFRLNTRLVPTYLRSLDNALWWCLLPIVGSLQLIHSLEPLGSREWSRELSLDKFREILLLLMRNLLSLSSLSLCISYEFSLLEPNDSLEITKWEMLDGLLGCTSDEESRLLYSLLITGLECWEWALELEREWDSRGWIEMLLSSFRNG